MRRPLLAASLLLCATALPRGEERRDRPLMPASAVPPASGGGMLAAHNQHAQVPSWVFSCSSAGLSNTSSSGAAPFEFGKGLLVYVQLSKTGSSSMRHMMFQAYGKPFSLYGCASAALSKPR